MHRVLRYTTFKHRTELAFSGNTKMINPATDSHERELESPFRGVCKKFEVSMNAILLRFTFIKALNYLITLLLLSCWVILLCLFSVLCSPHLFSGGGRRCSNTQKNRLLWRAFLETTRRKILKIAFFRKLHILKESNIFIIILIAHNK